MTKYAVMSYSPHRKHRNIGDEIQSLAAIHMLKNNNIHEYSHIDRENLINYTGPPVHLIMNGWFMYHLNKFPPAKNITPVFISFHCRKENLIRNNIKYFKRYKPIGCRDMHTKRMFEKYDIDAYFSGCLTLAFDEVNNKNENIYSVDINAKINKFLHLNPTIIEYDYQERDVQKRFNKANELLEIYKKAKLILTTRLHCALPCRAFGTNVLFMHENYNTDPRFTGLKKYINGKKELILNIKKQLNDKFTELVT